jgi:hypothetical protein
MILCIIETVFRIVSIVVVILATEFTISWNRIQGVDNTKSVGQLIPLMIGLSGVGHLLLEASRKPMNLKKIIQQDPHNVTSYAAAHNSGDEERQRRDEWPGWRSVVVKGLTYPPSCARIHRFWHAKTMPSTNESRAY